MPTHFGISDLKAREVLDCRGLPTVQVDVILEGRYRGRADVPAGRSTGSHEAVELRDGGKRFGGYGVRGAVGNVLGPIADTLLGKVIGSQRELDRILKELDGTANKRNLGANALLGVSLAYARACAAANDIPLYRWLNGNAHILPVPQFNLINGGRHASNDLDIQEFSIVPVGAGSLLSALEIATEVNLCLAEVLDAKFGKFALNTGDEGGFAPAVKEPEEALEYLHEAVKRAGYEPEVEYALDCAATHFYEEETATYTIAGKKRDAGEMADLYEALVRDYGITSLEDPFSEDAFEDVAALTTRLDIQIVGDDLLVTSAERLEKAINMGAGNALLWKMNQVGTLSEALDAAALAMRHGFGVVVSERSGETEDPIIADMVVALNAGQIKTGAPVRGERTAKYNALLVMEEQLGKDGKYAGPNYRRAW